MTALKALAEYKEKNLNEKFLPAEANEDMEEAFEELDKFLEGA